MKKYNSKIAVVILSILILIGCDGNYFNVTVEGTVEDSMNKTPIRNAKVIIKCWVFSTEKWHSEEVEQVLSTDKNGIFQAKFKKGEAIDITVIAESYLTNNQSKTLKRNGIKFAIFLEKK
jgi:hypothetical protein